jgi:hypothetical protein
MPDVDPSTERAFPATVAELDRSKGFAGHSPSPTPRKAREGAYATAAVLWGLGIVLLFLPYVNFYLSPLFFLAGAIYAWKIWHQNSVAGGKTY